MGFFFSDLGSGDEKRKEKNALQNDQLTGYLQSFFFHFQSFFHSFSELVFFFFGFFNISRINSKTSKVINQHSVLNL